MTAVSTELLKLLWMSCSRVKGTFPGSVTEVWKIYVPTLCHPGRDSRTGHRARGVCSPFPCSKPEFRILVVHGPGSPPPHWRERVPLTFLAVHIHQPRNGTTASTTMQACSNFVTQSESARTIQRSSVCYQRARTTQRISPKAPVIRAAAVANSNL